MSLYYVYTKSLCDADKIWLARFRKKYTCPECKDTLTEYRTRAFDVVLQELPDISAVNTVSAGPPGMDIARRDFLGLFQEEVASCLNLGRVYTNDERSWENFCTFAGTHLVALRGGRRPCAKWCNTCGNLSFFPGFGPWCVLRESVPDVPICQAWPLGGLILTEPLRKRIVKGKWKGIYIDDLPVVDEVADGIEVPRNPVIR